MNGKYKTITIYDAEKGKNIGKTFKISNFENEDKLLEHIEKIKKEQREKNKIFKENKINNTKTKIQSSNILDNIDNFILDKNTGTSTVILGSSKRGKSTIMMYIYRKFYQNNKNFISTLFSGNYHIDAYKNSKNLLIGDGFNEDSENYIKMQKYINSKTKNKYDFLNLFDDILDLKYKSIINRLILTYRNSNISSIMCLQYTYLLSKMNRANVNNIIIFGANTEEAKRDLIELYLKQHLINLGYINYIDRLNFFDYVTNDYGFFYINNLKQSFSIHRIPYNRIMD